MNNDNVITKKPGQWRCELFGMGNNIIIRPTDDNVPNFFWRFMQRIILGNKWIKDK